MRSNRNIIYASAIVGILSVVLLFIFQGNNICMSIFASIFASSIVGLIIPIINFYTIKKQAEIEFYSLCNARLNLVKDIANWFAWEEKTLDFEELNSVQAETDKEFEIKTYWLSKLEDKAKKGLDIIFNYANDNTSRFYSIIDDYCGLMTATTATKKKMFNIRDLFDKFSIYHIEPKNILHSAITLNYAFNGSVCKKNVFEPYKEVTGIDDNAVQLLIDELKQFLKLTKISSYTKKVQENK